MIVQGTPEWIKARCGRVTASRVADVVTRTRNGWSTRREAYMMELIAERLTGQPADKFGSQAMRWGAESEADAVAAYEWRADVTVLPAPFVEHPRIEWAGASPDGLVGADGLLEVKCPKSETHLRTLMTGEVPTDYAMQIMWQLACTGRAWGDFVSYDSRLPDHLRLFTRRLYADREIIDPLEEQVRDFLNELNARLDHLQRPRLEEAA